MEKAQIQEHVEGAIRTVLNNPTLEIKPESKLIDDLGIESIDLLDISSELEKSVGRELDFKEIAEKAASAPAAEAAQSAKALRVVDLVNFLHALVA